MISYLVGNGEKIKNITDLIFKIADTQTNIQVFGESGTGKELAARMIHSNSSKPPWFRQYNICRFWNS